MPPAQLPSFLPSTTVAALEKLIDGPRDGALLRFGLGREYLKSGDTARAIAMLRSAVARDPAYSAAWKILGKTLTETGQHDEARETLQQGITVAESRGDIQAAKEMKVFLRRLDRAQ